MYINYDTRFEDIAFSIFIVFVSFQKWISSVLYNTHYSLELTEQQLTVWWWCGVWCCSGIEIFRRRKILERINPSFVMHVFATKIIFLRTRREQITFNWLKHITYILMRLASSSENITRRPTSLSIVPTWLSLILTYIHHVYKTS